MGQLGCIPIPKAVAIHSLQRLEHCYCAGLGSCAHGVGLGISSLQHQEKSHLSSEVGVLALQEKQLLVHPNMHLLHIIIILLY